MKRSRTPRPRANLPADPVQVRAQRQMARWSRNHQAAFSAQLEKATSPLQREFLLRALAAEHSAGEMAAFARRIRLMGDRALSVACTVPAMGANGVRRPLAQLLRAEADPFYAFVLNGNSLETVRHDEDDAQQVSLVTSPNLNFPLVGRPQTIDLGSDQPMARTSASQVVRVMNPYEARLCEAVRALGFVYRVHEVGNPEEGQERMSLEDAVAALIDALWEGRPVPASLGNLQGHSRRRVLFLQASEADGGTALEVHDPVTGETVWVHDADLRSCNELPLSNKALRRLWELALPSRR